MGGFSERNWAIINSSNDGFWRIDFEGNILEVNKTYCSMSGYSEKELLSMNVSDLDARDNRESISAKISQLEKNSYCQFRSVHRRKDKTEYDVEIRVNYISDFGGLFFAYIRDISEIVAVERELVKVKDFGERHTELIRKINDSLSPLASGKTPETGNSASLMQYELELLKAIEKKRSSELVNKVCLHLLYHSKSHTAREVVMEYLLQIEKLTNATISYCYINNRPGYRTSAYVWSANATAAFNNNKLDEIKLREKCLTHQQQCLQTRQPLIVNSPPGSSEKLQSGTSLINHCLLIIPVTVNDNVESLIGLIKEGENFRDEYIEMIQFVTDIAREILNRKLAEEKANKLKKASENTHISIVITNSEGNIEYANPYFSQLTGYSEEEYIGEKPQILKSGFHSAQFYKNLWTTINEGKTWEGEFYNRKKDGSHYWENATISPIKNEKDEIVSFVAVKKDITETKAMMEALLKAKEEAEESRRWFEAIFYTSPAPISITRLNGEYVDVNEQFVKISGYTKEELIGNKADDISIWADPTDRQKLIRRIREHRFIDNMETSFILKNGTVRHYIVSAKLVEFGKEPMILLVSKDVTQQKEAEAMLIATKEKAEESDRLKTAFLHNISHEIRTPMNAIMGFSELLSDVSDDKETMQQYIRIINQRCQDLLVIINGILDISSIECGQVAVYNETFSLDELYKELLELSFEQQLRLNKQHIPLHISPHATNLDFRITSDLGKLKQIFMNLINNALKYTHEGSVTIGHRMINEGELQFFVSDTGIGIDQNDFNKLFVRFKQLEHTTNDHWGGNGLGLAICKGLVDALDGEIGVQSEIGKGSTFYFSVKYGAEYKPANYPARN